MKWHKILLFTLALLLLLALNFAVVYGCLYQFVFTFPLDGDPALLGEEYQGAEVLSVSERDPRVLSGRYLLVRTAAGETRLLVMEDSAFFADRVRYLPEQTVAVPEERPFSCMVHVFASAAEIQIDKGNQLRQTFFSGGGGPGAIEMMSVLLPLALLGAELLVWMLLARRKGKQAEEQTGAMPAWRNESPEDTSKWMDAAFTLDRHSLRSGVGHPAQRVRPKQIFVPLAGVLAFAALSLAAIYFVFHEVVFSVQYDGDPASLGEAYQGAAVTMRRRDSDTKREILVLETADGARHVLALDGSELIRPGWYHAPRELPDVPEYDSGFNLWAGLEAASVFFYLPMVWGLAVFVSHRIKPKKAETDDV